MLKSCMNMHAWIDHYFVTKNCFLKIKYLNLLNHLTKITTAIKTLTMNNKIIFKNVVTLTSFSASVARITIIVCGRNVLTLLSRYFSVFYYVLFFVCFIHTAPVLLADYVTTGNGLKMASTAAYNLWDNYCYSIANFNFNLTLIRCSN